MRNNWLGLIHIHIYAPSRSPWGKFYCTRCFKIKNQAVYKFEACDLVNVVRRGDA
jgi:hypothetical protein